MSVRLRLFLLIGSLAVVLLVSEWALVHSLTGELTSEVGEVAVSVGRGVISGVTETRVLVARDARNGVVHRPPHGAGLSSASPERNIETDGEHDLQRVVPSEEELARFEDLSRLVDGMTLDEKQQIHIGMLDANALVLPVGAPCDDSTAEGQTTVMAEDGSIRHQVVRRIECLDEDVHTTVVGRGSGESPGSFEATFNLTLERAAGARVLFLSGPDARVHEIPIPVQPIEDAIERTSGRLLLGSLGILAVGLLVAGVIAHRVSAPLRNLAFAARSVGEGNLGARAPEAGSGEVGEAIRSFNRMSSRLEELDAAADEMRTREHLSEIGEIARGLAHSLRNPLNALGLSVEELAARTTTGDVSAELVTSSRRQIRRMDHSIRSFLALASGGAGEVEDVDVLALVQDVVLEVLQDTRQRTPVKIEERDASLPAPSLTGIAPELRAVIQALLVNAVEASPPGSVVRVRLTETLQEPRVRLEIEDAGAGVPVEVRARLFTPHTTTKATGSGMGLFLAHRIASSRYAGSLEVRDREPRGTVAVLLLGDREVVGRA